MCKVTFSIDDLRLVVSEEFKKSCLPLMCGNNCSQNNEKSTLLTLSQVAAYFGKSRQAILQWRKAGYLPIGTRLGKSLYFEKSAIESIVVEAIRKKEVFK